MKFSKVTMEFTDEQVRYLQLVIDGHLHNAKLRIKRRHLGDRDTRRNTAVGDRRELVTLRELQRKFGPYEVRLPPDEIEAA